MTRLTFPKIALTIILLVTSSNYCFAGAALKITPMQSSITGVIATKAKQRGFAANDPRFLATVDAVSGGLSAAAGGAAATVVVGAITAPAWATVAIGIGVGAVVTAAVSLALDGTLKWLMNPDPASSTPIQQMNAAGTPVGGLKAGSPFWEADDYVVSPTSPTAIFQASDPSSAVNALIGYKYETAFKQDTSSTYYIESCHALSGTEYGCSVSVHNNTYNTTTTNWATYSAYYHAEGASITCASGQVNTMTGCTALKVIPTTAPVTPLTRQQAIDNAIASPDINKPLNPAIVAAIADKAWRDAAAKPGYSGLPYDATDPITKDDADTYRQSHPTTYPTVNDFVQPQPTPNKPFNLPYTDTQTVDNASTSSPAINPASSQPLTNLGADPVTPQPTLEATPTAAMILQPILSLFPDFKSFVVPSHQSVCPKPVFNLFGKSIVMDAQCTLAEQQRSALYAIMALVWLIAAATIVLRA